MIDRSVYVQLQEDLDAESLKTAVDFFCQEINERLETIENNLQKNDYAVIALQAHSLKGSAMTFGATKLADLCFSVESAAEQQNGEHIQTIFPDLKETGEKTLSLFQSVES